MNIRQKLTTAAVIGGMALSVFAPAASFAAENNVKIKNNGKNSDNKVKIENRKKTKIRQSNTTVATTFIGVISNTGGNKANGNTGKGDVDVKSGDVTNGITVGVEGNTNTADIPCLCEENEGNVDATISGNGKNSDNKIKVKNSNTVKVTQSSISIVTTAIGTASNTGNNKANGNTGAGDKTVESGDVDNTIEVNVEGSTNTLN